jgi:hypothetical protein
MQYAYKWCLKRDGCNLTVTSKWAVLPFCLRGKDRQFFLTFCLTCVRDTMNQTGDEGR